MDILSHPLSKQAIAWGGATSPLPVVSTEILCDTRDVLRARIDSLAVRLLRKNIGEGRVRLLDAVLSEIGSNSFDHNIGQWRDAPGVFFSSIGIDAGRLCILADRGQGVLTTLRRVRPELSAHAQALHLAFTERISGRAPEQRGNGLKFVRNVLLEDGIDLWYGSGNAAYAVQGGVEEWPTADPPMLGCCAILLLHCS